VKPGDAEGEMYHRGTTVTWAGSATAAEISRPNPSAAAEESNSVMNTAP
jgi:hypothetical protein